MPLSRKLTFEVLEDRTMPSGGSWTPLTNAIANGAGTMLLLTDGTVMAQGGDGGNTWHRLSPDASGSYVNGSWTPIQSMHNTRLYYASAVLPDGRVIVAGGEFGTGTKRTEIYDPASDSWEGVARAPLGDIGDIGGEVLPDGRFVIGSRQGPATRIYDPKTNTWMVAASKLNNDNTAEESWALLPEGSILSAEIKDNLAQKYIPSQDTWVSAGTVPAQLGATSLFEIGASVLLNDGRIFAIGATGHTDVYTPGPTAMDQGSWQAGPDIPGGFVADDAPAALLTNGHVLVVGDSGHFKGPSAFFEYDPVANMFCAVPAPSADQGSNPSFVFRMLELPTGQILMSDGGENVFAYTPVGNPDPSWKPTISHIKAKDNGTYVIAGTQLSGRSEGAYYGDDANMSSNYPLVRLVNEAGQVSYARTYNFSTMAVATGSLPESAHFTLPAALPGGKYFVSVVTNGIASDPKTITINTPNWLAAADSPRGNSGSKPGLDQLPVIPPRQQHSVELNHEIAPTPAGPRVSGPVFHDREIRPILRSFLDGSIDAVTDQIFVEGVWWDDNGF